MTPICTMMIFTTLAILIINVIAFTRPWLSHASLKSPARSLSLQARRPAIHFPLGRVAQDLAHAFDDWDLFPASLAPGTASLPNLMPMDIRETNTTYQILLDLPGVKVEDIHLTKHHHEIRISAERHTEQKEEHQSYRRVERHIGSVSRTIALPENADKEHIQADYKHGVLAITIPKLEHEVTEEKRIDINTGE